MIKGIVCGGRTLKGLSRRGKERKWKIGEKEKKKKEEKKGKPKNEKGTGEESKKKVGA
jgi:hypothetical protein